MSTVQIIGHITQRDALRREVAAGSLHHALLFSGPSGIGKSLIARELAKGLMCENSENRSAPDHKLQQLPSL